MLYLQPHLLQHSLKQLSFAQHSEEIHVHMTSTAGMATKAVSCVCQWLVLCCVFSMVQVIQACALEPDIAGLSAGDLTELGERGINVGDVLLVLLVLVVMVAVVVPMQPTFCANVSHVILYTVECILS
jgi:hypothetical protein